MMRPRKRLTRRNDTPKQHSAFPAQKGSSSFSAAQVVLVFGCVWLIGFLGLVAWYIRGHGATHSSPGRLPGVPGPIVEHPYAFSRRNNNQEPLKKEDKVETLAPGIQTGVKHVPNLLPLSEDPDAYRSPVIIFTCKRDKYLAETLDDILANIGDHCAFGCPVVVSEDGYHDWINTTVQEYSAKFQAKGIPLIHMQHDQKLPPPPAQGKLRARYSPVSAYRALAQHYGWAIQQVFDGLDASLPTADRVIILEEDIHTAPDFFSYMKATSVILDQDSSLLAVSAYNDNGHQVKDTHRILRSDFFPGLGWMMTRKLWKEELESKWPPAYWDDWLREPAQRKNRHVLRPEVSRTFHFGDKGGTSRNQFGSILSRVRLNQDAVDWTQQDLSYLHEQPFDEQYGKLLATASLATTIKDAIDRVKTSNIRVEYTSLDEFKRYAEDLDIMKDEKAGIPRTAYKGVVEVRPYDEHILFLTPVTAKLEASFPALAAMET